MPAITSPLRALRFSGRLMVIQNACPRFSSTTLLLSVMPCSPRQLSAGINGRMAANCKDDLGVRNRWHGLLRPDLVVMECGAPDPRNRLGAGERIDAPAADVGLIGVHRFRHPPPAAQTLEEFGGQRSLPP